MPPLTSSDTAIIDELHLALDVAQREHIGGVSGDRAMVAAILHRVLLRIEQMYDNAPMAKGFGRTLDWTTLIVVIRNQMNAEDVQRFHLVFDKDQGYTAYFGSVEPDEPKWFETHDSALLALHIGNEAVPGIDDG